MHGRRGSGGVAAGPPGQRRAASARAAGRHAALSAAAPGAGRAAAPQAAAARGSAGNRGVGSAGSWKTADPALFLFSPFCGIQLEKIRRGEPPLISCDEDELVSSSLHLPVMGFIPFHWVVPMLDTTPS